MHKKIIKLHDTGIEEFEFHEYKIPILINEIDINEIVVSDKFPFGKQDFNISLVTKIIKKLNLYAYSFQKRMYIE